MSGAAARIGMEPGGRPVPVLPGLRAVADGPDFFCVGAQKGGTRWLYDQVQLHPDFWMPPIKELHYFDRDEASVRATELAARSARNLKRTNKRRHKRSLRPFDERDIAFFESYRLLPWRKKDLDAYAALFAARGDRITGDITPDYCVLETAMIARIATRFPAAKVVFIARDPVERVWSHLCMHMRIGDIDRTVSAREAMRLVEKRFIARRTYQSEIVARWRAAVPEARFGLFLFDDLVSDPQGLRARILGFLGADPDKPSGNMEAGYNRKSDPHKAPLMPEIREALAAHLADEIRASARAFGGAAAGWPAKYGL